MDAVEKELIRRINRAHWRGDLAEEMRWRCTLSDYRKFFKEALEVDPEP